MGFNSAFEGLNRYHFTFTFYSKYNDGNDPENVDSPCIMLWKHKENAWG